ncbi:aggregation factor core [Yoonia sp. BS5-3]|uniref:Aggregation factor core n=1 Tax=Yoonia phaeophyticola TaxID=3137369 RepID=A0ABZ2V3B1_9RHOB
MKFSLALITTCLLAAPALADVQIRFIESAPKDRFVLINTGCPLQTVDVAIDLSQSQGGLIFDVTADGAGVEVFQPVQVEGGAVTLAAVTDGDQRLNFQINGFATNAEVVISADLDDVLANSPLGQIRVADNELSGTAVQMTIDGQSTSSVFAPDTDVATVPTGCIS